jgi:hypothetical protein
VKGLAQAARRRSAAFTLSRTAQPAEPQDQQTTRLTCASSSTPGRIGQDAGERADHAHAIAPDASAKPPGATHAPGIALRAAVPVLHADDRKQGTGTTRIMR